MKSRLYHISDWVVLARQANYSVTRLAALCQVTVRTLERHFIEIKGVRPHDWLHAQRLLQAPGVLQESKTIKEAASVLGFKRAGHFTRAFKKQHGRTPSEFLLPPEMAAQSGAAGRPMSHLDNNCRI